MEAQEGGRELLQRLDAQERGRHQLRPQRLPLLRLELRELGEHVLEHPALEPGQIGQRRAGGVAQPALRELERGEQRLVAALQRRAVGEARDQLAELAADLLRRVLGEVGGDEGDGQGMVGEGIEQPIHLGALVARALHADALRVHDRRQQVQAVGAREAFERHLLDAGEPGLLRAASHQQAALRGALGELPVEPRERLARWGRVDPQGVRIAAGRLRVRPVLKGGQGGLEVVPHQQHRAAAEQRHRLAPLIVLRARREALALERRAQALDHLLRPRPLLEADEDRRLEAARAQPPGRGFARQRRLAHAAHGVQQHRRVAAERPLDRQQLLGAAVEAVHRGRRKAVQALRQRGPRRLARGFRRLRGSGQHRVLAHLVELRDEPVVQVHGLGIGPEVQPACPIGVKRAAGIGERLADAHAAGQLPVEALDQQPRGLDVHRVAEGDDAAHAALEQGRRHRAEHRPLRELGAAAGLEQHDGHPKTHHQVAEPRAGDEVAGLVVLLEGQRPYAGPRQIGAVAVEVDDVEGLLALSGLGYLRLEPAEGGRIAEIELELARAEGLERIEHRRDAVARVDEPGVARPAHDQQHPQRQVQLGRPGLARLAQLAAQADPLEAQRAARVPQQLPGLAQDLGVVARQGQQHRPVVLGRRGQVFINRPAVTVVEQGVEQGRAPLRKPRLETLGAGPVAGAGKLHVGLQIPAQRLQVLGPEGQGEGEFLALIGSMPARDRRAILAGHHQAGLVGAEPPAHRCGTRLNVIAGVLANGRQ